MKYVVMALSMLAVSILVIDKTASAQMSMGWKSKDFAWTKQVIKNDNSRFLIARKSLNRYIRESSSKNKTNLTDAYGMASDQYRKIWVSNPKDNVALFRWAYSAYYASAKYDDQHEMNAYLEPIAVLLQKNTTSDFEFVRLRFLVEGMLNQYVAELIPLGEKLLKVSPNDLTVKYRLVSLLRNTPSVKDKERAVQLSEQVVQVEKSPHYIAFLGDSYYSLWFLNDDVAVAKKAIILYERFLSLEPKNTKEYKNVSFILTRMKKRLAR